MLRLRRVLWLMCLLSVTLGAQSPTRLNPRIGSYNPTPIPLGLSIFSPIACTNIESSCPPFPVSTADPIALQGNSIGTRPRTAITFTCTSSAPGTHPCIPASGTATGLTTWTTSIVPGCDTTVVTNTVVITAADGLSTPVTVTFPIPCHIEVGNLIDPVITVQSGTTISPSTSPIHITGKCTDDTQCVSVFWQCSPACDTGGVDVDVPPGYVPGGDQPWALDVPMTSGGAELPAGDYAITLSAWDEAGNHSGTAQQVVTAHFKVTLSVGTSAVPNAEEGQTYRTTDIRAIGGKTPYTAWATVAGSPPAGCTASLPTGMTLTQTTAADGQLVYRLASSGALGTGIGSDTGTCYSVAVRVTDTDTLTATRQISFKVFTAGHLEGPHDFYGIQVARGPCTGGVTTGCIFGGEQTSTCSVDDAGAFSLRNDSQINCLTRQARLFAVGSHYYMEYIFGTDDYEDKQDGVKLTLPDVKPDTVAPITTCDVATDICTTSVPTLFTKAAVTIVIANTTTTPSINGTYQAANIKKVKDAAGKVLSNAFRLIGVPGCTPTADGWCDLTAGGAQPGNATWTLTSAVAGIPGSQHIEFEVNGSNPFPTPTPTTQESLFVTMDLYFTKAAKIAFAGVGDGDYKFKGVQLSNPGTKIWFEHRFRWQRPSACSKSAGGDPFSTTVMSSPGQADISCAEIMYAHDTRLYDFDGGVHDEDNWCLINAVGVQGRNNTTGEGSIPNDGGGGLRIPHGKWIRVQRLVETYRDAATDFPSWRNAVASPSPACTVVATGKWDRITEWISIEGETGVHRVLYLAPARNKSTQDPVENIGRFYPEFNTSGASHRNGIAYFYIRNATIEKDPTISDAGCLYGSYNPATCDTTHFKNPVR